MIPLLWRENPPQVTSLYEVAFSEIFHFFFQRKKCIHGQTAYLYIFSTILESNLHDSKEKQNLDLFEA